MKSRNWTEEEIIKLIDFRGKNFSLPKIGVLLNRTPEAIELKSSRLIKLGRCLPKKKAIRITDPVANFWSYINKSEGENACWLWVGAKTGGGYGVHVMRFAEGIKREGAHRIAFIIHKGREITPTLHILHSCDTPACCNPKHLSEGTRSQNAKEAYERHRRKPNCIRGDKSHSAKVNWEIVKEIRSLSQEVPRRELAKKYNLSISGIGHIISGKTWKC